MKSQPSHHRKPQKFEAGKGERDMNAFDDSIADDPIGNDPIGNDPIAEDWTADDLVTLARRYYAEGFPNPERLGCPTSGEIARVVGERRAPDQTLREHLFECSECFREYRQALAQGRQSSRDEIAGHLAGWMRLVQRYTPIYMMNRVTVATVILAALIFVGILFWRHSAPDVIDEQMARGTTTVAPIGAPIIAAKVAAPNQAEKLSGAGIGISPVKESAPVEESAPIKESAMVNGSMIDGASRSSGMPEPVAAGARTIDVDLDNYRALREPQVEKPPDISLPATRASMILRLPETGIAGNYLVSLVGAFGQVLWSTSAVSRDGSKLRVTLDLRRVPPQKYRLRLSRKGEAPAYYDVIVRKQ